MYTVVRTCLTCLTLATCLALIALPCAGVTAATFTVTSSGDAHDLNPGNGAARDGSGFASLRAAMEEASALAGPDTILIPSDVSPIRVLLGTLEITDDGTVIVGDSGLPVIDGVNCPLHSTLLSITANNCLITGVTVQRSRGHALRIEGMFNRVGLPDTTPANVFSNNGLDGSGYAAIAVVGTWTAGTEVAANYIGLEADGASAAGNRIGVLIDAATYGLVGGDTETARNVFVDNDSAGIVITNGANRNTVRLNYIGPDVSGRVAPGHQRHGIVIDDGAFRNTIGGDSLLLGNLISGNDSTGITVNGDSSDRNYINGNYIGVDRTGRLRLGNGGPGIRISDHAYYTLIGDTTAAAGNLISGNYGSGIHITSGALLTRVYANLIGTNILGYSSIGNGLTAGDGIRIDGGATVTQVGLYGPETRNIISGNVNFGVHVLGPDTENNWIRDNFIGTNGLGTSSLWNAAGVVLDSGAHHNYVSDNLISGNRADFFPNGAGVIIRGSGTNENIVGGNIIGLDVDGARAIPNAFSGVIIGDGASYNHIGGSGGSRNVISGNGDNEGVPGRAGGIHIYGAGTVGNSIYGNLIGLSANELSVIGNLGHGVGVFSGASANTIGGAIEDYSNTIVGSKWYGILIEGPTTVRNSIRLNRIYDNDSAAIALTLQSQEQLTPPSLEFAWLNLVTGSGAPPLGTVDVFLAAPDESGAGGSRAVIGTGVADESGDFVVAVTGVSAQDTVTAVVTDTSGNSSAFAANILVRDLLSVDDVESQLPRRLTLSQNYPNPFNPTTTIAYDLPRASSVHLSVLNSLGQLIRTIVAAQQPAGRYQVTWDGRSDSGVSAAAGVYFYRLKTDTGILTRKMILLK